ncbi:Mediator of RNA polymerase II transcription subunit 9 [Acorus calamus]|uniref:Mediator of RNA polymerase II transcription subunit 9 n=1 Tax=Acorus calamus TaxID=4465 RepID=A0AAV9CKL3_ACOCL|nr:Mediator of RNA polymerase II transcription subunit 9 [Acorus calamus]
MHTCAAEKSLSVKDFSKETFDNDMKVNELTNNFEKCQQLLNSISASISSKAITVEGQKHKLEETEQLGSDI